MEKLLYIGSGLDFKPIIHFRQVKEFVFIDSQPRSVADEILYNGSLFIDGLYRYNFIDLNYYKQILTQEQKKSWVGIF